MGRPLPEEWMDRDAREIMEAVMVARISRELELNDEQTVLMMRRISEFKQETDEARKRRGELVRALNEAVRSGAAEANVEAKLHELVDHDRALAEAKFGMFERAGEGLNVAQRAKLYLFLGEFETDMRKLIQKARMRAAGWGYQRPFAEGMRPESGPGLDEGHGPGRPIDRRFGGPEQRRRFRGPGRRGGPFQPGPDQAQDEPGE